MAHFRRGRSCVGCLRGGQLNTRRRSTLSLQPMIPDHVYHLVEAPNWPSVQRHGLLSTRELLRLTDVPPDAQEHIATTQRLRLTALSDQVGIRDQLPIPPIALQKCLVGITPPQWYALLNQMVFFWCDRERLNRQLRACGGRPQIVLTLDTKQLLARYAERVALTPFNTGNARRKPAIRGRATFVPYLTWLASGWRSEAEALGVRQRLCSHSPVELTVPGAVPDATEFTVGIEYVRSDNSFRNRNA
jgi:hypothetical protein